MNSETIADCMKLSFADTPFPGVVRRLADAGVHAYTADLIALRNTYYGDDRESVDEPVPLQPSPAVAGIFDKASVATSVQAVQRGEIGYTEFLWQIMRAGCASYRVFIDGRKVMYFGRDGDFHTEHFPPLAN